MAAVPPSLKSPSIRSMTPAQVAYETKRAKKAGMSLDKWMDAKRKQAAAEAKALAKAAEPPPQKKSGFLSRLMERAHKPF